MRAETASPCSLASADSVVTGARRMRDVDTTRGRRSRVLREHVGQGPSVSLVSSGRHSRGREGEPFCRVLGWREATERFMT